MTPEKLFEIRFQKILSETIIERAISKMYDTEFYLTPNTEQKSFYKKAMVKVFCWDKMVVLYSYNTQIMRYDTSAKKVQRLWFGYSATTQKHINAFLDLIGKSEYAGKHNTNKMETGEWY